MDDRLFETLDPTTRAFREDGRTYLVTDTVGFIGKLPHMLVEAFAATLEETLAGDLVLLVADASAGEDGLGRQLADVRAVLGEIGAEEIPQMLVMNKIDTVDALAGGGCQPVPRRVQISAQTGENLDELKHRSPSSSATATWMCACWCRMARAASSRRCTSGAPITAREDAAEGVLVTARLPRDLVGRFAAFRGMTELLVRRLHPDARSARGRLSRRRGPRPGQRRGGRARPRASGDRRHRPCGRDPGRARRLRPAPLGAGRPPRDHRCQLARPDRLAATAAS